MDVQLCWMAKVITCCAGQYTKRLLCTGAVLGWHLRQHGISAEALRGFNAERGPRVKEVYTKVCSLRISLTDLLTIIDARAVKT